MTLLPHHSRQRWVAHAPITRALVVRPHWLDLILSGAKPWEIRGATTHVRGPIGLIASASGQVCGVAHLGDAIGPLSRTQLRRETARHRVPPAQVDGISYRTPHAWVMEAPLRLATPVDYQHPSGAVIWVRLEQDVQRALARAIQATLAR